MPDKLMTLINNHAIGESGTFYD